MIRWVNVSFAIALVFTIAALYHIRYSAEGEARNLKKIERAIAMEEDRQRTLRAEWSSLNNPRRLQMLARNYLELDHLRPSQVMDLRPVETKKIPIILPVSPTRKGGAHEPR